LPYQARDGVGYAAGGKTDDDADRLRRIGLRPRHARDCWEDGSTKRKIHVV
jgi:hypothetical protein